MVGIRWMLTNGEKMTNEMKGKGKESSNAMVVGIWFWNKIIYSDYSQLNGLRFDLSDAYRNEASDFHQLTKRDPKTVSSLILSWLRHGV